MKRERTCWICEEYEQLRLQAGREGIRIGKERPIGFICPDHGRFLLFGPTPKTRREVDDLARDLKLQLGLSQPPGPKKKRLTLADIIHALEKVSPHDSLAQFAAALGVSPRKAQELVKQMCGQTFRDIQAARRGGPGTPWARKYRRRRR